MIHIRGLKKRVHDGFHIEINHAHIGQGLCMISGSNSSGKSVFLELLASAAEPDEGELLWKGVPYRNHLAKLRNQIGYAPSEVRAYEEMTAREFLHYMAGLKGMMSQQHIAAVLELFRLDHLGQERMKALSYGVQQRLVIAQSFIGAPSIIIMDDPLRHVDTFEAERLRTLFALYARSRTVIIADVDPSAWVKDQHLTMNDGELHEYTNG